jgi:hypothetical protein
LSEVRGGIGRVADCQHTGVGVSGQGVDGIKDRLRDPASFVDQNKRVQRMNALERGLIMISRLAPEGNELFPTRPHVPLVIERDATRQVALAMSLADIPP